jgi:hypothetical protein
MMRALAIAHFAIFVCWGQTQYRFESLNGGNIFRFASASQISDNGSVIGRVFRGDRQPAVFSPELGIVTPPLLIEIAGINASGDIVGTTHLAGGSVAAFLSRPPYDRVINLNTVFGWASGSAIGINDAGDIIGSGDPRGLNPSDIWFPGLNISGVIAINNAGQILAYSFINQPGHNIEYFLYSPGKGVTVLPTFPRVLNNRGDLLLGVDGAQYIQTASDQIPLPSGYSWVSMNDSDQAVGYGFPNPETATATPVFFSVATGLVNLSTWVVNPEDYLQIMPVGINNRGQIAVNYSILLNPFFAPYAGVGLLVPVAGTPREGTGIAGTSIAGTSIAGTFMETSGERLARISGHAQLLRVSPASTGRAYRLNGMPFETSGPIE